MIELLGGVCAACGISDTDVLQIDHIEPIRQQADERMSLKTFIKLLLRGDHPTDNLQILCANCHMKKSSREHPLV